MKFKLHKIKRSCSNIWVPCKVYECDGDKEKHPQSAGLFQWCLAKINLGDVF